MREYTMPVSSHQNVQAEKCVSLPLTFAALSAACQTDDINETTKENKCEGLETRPCPLDVRRTETTGQMFGLKIGLVLLEVIRMSHWEHSPNGSDISTLCQLLEEC